MEADWDELTRIVVPAPGIHAGPTIATTLAFDEDQELLWIGNEHGRIASFHGPELQRYVSLKAHPGEGPIRQFLFQEKGVISLSPSSVHFTTRRGLTIWHLTHQDMHDLRCMTATSNPSQILVAGCQRSMFIVDVDKGIVIEQLQAESNYILMKKSRYICAATDNGTIDILDNDFKVIKTWKPHNAINDMDARNDFLVTCGFSVRHTGTSIVDPLANVFDLKTLRPIQPIPFHAGAAFVRLHPKLQTTSFVASQTGQMQVIDLMNPNTVNLRQANVSFMVGMELSNSGEALVISDADCSVHLWGSPNKIHFSKASKETEFADPQPVRPPHVGWNDEPLSTIGMPYYHEKLLSAWPSHMIFGVGAPPPQVDPALIPYLQGKADGVQYAPNPRKTHRYQAEDTRLFQIETSMTAPKFLSEKAKDTAKAPTGRRASDAAQALAATTLDDRTGDEALLKYSNVEIKYSRFGVDDFDFRYYNKTEFSGLETHIGNSYTNSLLQLYKFMPLIRNLALHHAATSCFADPCHLCELGFLFDMLEKAAGQNCQATNLLKTYSSSPEASRLGLLEDGNVQPMTERIESANRFFLNRISGDFRQMIGNTDDVDEVLATTGWQSTRCLVCGDETVQPSVSYSTDLIYPNIDPKHAARNAALRFSSILKSSLENVAQQTPRGYCTKCRSYRQMAKRKTVSQTPFVLMVNALLTSPKYRSLWETQGWLPTEIGILVQGRSIYCFEGNDLALHQRNDTQGLMVYELVGFVAQIDIAEHHRPHLVSFVNVDVSSRQPQPVPIDPSPQAAGSWHLFNDFLVTPLTAREALLFNSTWKIPTVLGYQIKTAHGAIDDSWRDSLDPSILFHPYSVNNVAPQPDISILTPPEQPAPGTPIALDTEFVDLEKAEIDVKADGTQETIRPSKSGLARVSVLRGSGEAEAIPFIDDYITIRDPIVDYKTQYSGIRPGDLDIRTSTHNLVPLKVAYKKLWLLLNLGCVFVGHGLASDFRKINIQVPKTQTVDTQFLYLQPGKNRRLSLRYLAWAVFREFIQEEPMLVTTTTTTAPIGEGDLTTSQAAAATTTSTAIDLANIEGHDSITDAHMALRLWRKYLEWEDAGVVEQMVDEIYRDGFKYGYRPPIRTPAGGVATAVPAGVVGVRGGGGSSGSGRNTPDPAIGGFGSAPGTPNRGSSAGAGVAGVRTSIGTPKGGNGVGGGALRGFGTPK